MNLCAFAPGAGHRRLDERTASTERLADSYSGLPANISHRHVLTAFKRAAPYIGIPPRLVHAIDTLMSWSREIDWREGQRPIVFPSNEKLSQKLGVGVRQLQKLLNSATRWGLVAHRDSANGKRTGARGKDGRLIYAYGIDLSPLGVRYEELVRIAEEGTKADLRIEVMRKRLTAARRRIRSLAQLVIDEAMPDVDATGIIEIAQLATQQMRKVRDERLLQECVEALEGHAVALGESIRLGLDVATKTPEPRKESSLGVKKDTHYTTTKQPPIAKATDRSGLAKKSSVCGYDVRNNEPQSDVEADLAHHGVDPSFIAAVVPEFVSYPPDQMTWGIVIRDAERLIAQTAIPANVWHEACRLMGQKGAAASVFATAHKHVRGDVDRPGAYLRGMNKNAASGKLNLGRTFHGLKDHAKRQPVRSLSSGTDPRSVGQLLAMALRSAGRVTGPALL
ncbi:plasmid replication protein RepC [Sphingomonas aerolata]|uniref:plasmid replication protein RepC n=1 Tax=Sphingomonas aerolata TaxID=185951 RepID=UPI00335E3465